MKKLLLSVEVILDEATDMIQATVKNEGYQGMAALALAQLMHNHLNNAPQKDRAKIKIGLIMDVMDYLHTLETTDMTIIDIRALQRKEGGGDE